MGDQVKLVLAGVLSALLTCGMYEQVFNIEPNKCDMTYMYQLPQYIPIKLPSHVVERFPYYSLYAYGEGRYSESLKKGLYTGIPVLFIPGNSGSHKQVRSLASVAFRKALDDETDFHFNFFTVDINEELGAFYGPVLEKQTEFVAIVVNRILELYTNATVIPKSVILVGHSMGGMVARAVYTLDTVAASKVSLIITLATPHTRPVLVLDQYLEQFYEKVNTYWIMERSLDLKDVVLVSIGGARNDVQVPTSHTITPLADVATTTTNVPSCWMTTDHQAIVWCRQLVLAIVRALFDCVDPNTLRLTTSRKLITDVFEYHLSKRITGKRYKSSFYSPTIELNKEGDWNEIVKRQHTHIAQTTPSRTYLMIPLNPGHQLYHEAAIVATNLDNKHWVAACNANYVHKGNRICLTGENLSNYTKKLKGKMKTVELDLESLGATGHTHIIVSIPATDERVEIAIDVHSKTGRQRTIDVPAFFRSFIQTLIVDTTPQKALSYNVTLRGLEDMWQSFKLILRPRSACATENVPMAKMYLPWVQKEFYLQNSGPGVSYIAEIDIPRLDDNSSSSIQFILNPACTYSILIQGSFVGVFRRLVWLYGSQIPSYCAAHLLLTLAKQLRTIGIDGYCPSFFSSMLTLSPLAIVPFIKISSIILKNFDVSDDIIIMNNNGEELAILPILLFLGTLPLSLATGAATWGLVLLSGNAAHTFVLKVLGHSLGGRDVIADLAVSGLSRVPIVVGVALISLAYSSCGTLALLLAGIFYFIKVFKLYEDYIERILLGLIPGTSGGESSTDRALSRVHFNMTIMMLVFVVVILNMPTLIIWSRLVSNNLPLTEDPTLSVTVTLLVTLCFLWQKKLPKTDRKYYKVVSWVIHFMACITLLFGSIHIYRVPYFVTGALVLLAVHQTLAPRASNDDSDDEDDEQDHDTPSRSSHPFMAEIGRENGSNTEGIHSEVTTPGSDTGTSQSTAGSASE
ncbi:GPI inositol-deacylase [Cherax quadricarinatus]|nr:GPI inositol-deacylase-like [Cherax quadricarinatus]